MAVRQKISQFVIVMTIALSGMIVASQWLVHRLGRRLELGRPIAHIGGLKLYYPWSFFFWWYRFNRVDESLFDGAGAIAGSAGLLACIAGAILNGWQQRSIAATTYGSARWATRADIRRAGLHASDGEFLRHDGKRYLRHDGPEHIIAVAPTRSGKGVGLVLPTLLSWKGSAIIHDLKGENWALTAGWRSLFSHCLYFNPTETRSAHYNPLLEVRKGKDEIRDVQNIADILVDPDGFLERRSHWHKTSHSLLGGAILHVLYARADKSLAGVAIFLSDPDCSFAETLDAMMTTNHLGTSSAPLVHTRGRQELYEQWNRHQKGQGEDIWHLDRLFLRE